MNTNKELIKSLLSIDGKSYGLYKSLKGDYHFDRFILKIDKIQADPYAPPSKMRLIIDSKITGMPDEIIETKEKRIVVSDFFTRIFYSEIEKIRNSAC